MVNIKNIIYILLAMMLTGITACNDDKEAIDYTDDSAYPPPVVTITSPTSLSGAEFKKEQTVTASFESTNGLRDVYATLLKKAENDTYEEIDKSLRVYQSLDGFPNELDASFTINVSDKLTAAIGVFATDIYTKTIMQQVTIGYLVGIPPVITLEPSEIAQVDLNQSLTIKGTASSGTGLSSISYTLIQKSPYLELSTSGNIAVSPSEKEKEFSFSIVINDERADAISVVATDKDGYKETAYVEIKSITGVPEGKAAIFDNIELAPEWESPDNPTQPYLFSFDGVTVGGQLKNILTLQDAVNSSGGSIDFAFVNFWRNSGFVPIANRGPGFASADRISSGTVGRQVDVPWLSVITNNAVFFKIIPSEIVSAMKLEELFETATGNWETYQALEPLSSFVTGTATGDKQCLQRTGASADRTDDVNLQIVDGTYIAIRREYASAKKYGIIKVVKAVDDTPALNNQNKILGVSTDPGKSAYYKGPNQAGFDYIGVTKLYGQKCKLKIIVQK